MNVQQYLDLLSAATSLNNIPEPPDPVNTFEVEQCHQAYTLFLEQHPNERDAVIHRVVNLPSDSRWSSTLLDWATAGGHAETSVVDASVNLLKHDLSKPWVSALAGNHTARLEQIRTRWTESDLESLLASCERLLRSEAQSRLDICVLLFSIVSGTEQWSPLTAAHSVLGGILDSLLYDTSNQLFAVALKLYTLVTPYALAHLTQQVPRIMIVLGRAVNWRDRPFAETSKDGTTPTPLPAKNSSWQALRIDKTSTSALQPHTVVGMFIATVYNAWPSNVLAFVRDPVLYIQGKKIDPIYDVSWPDVWPSRSLAARASPLLCKFHLHPLLVEHTSSAELRDTARWDKLNPSEFTARAHALAHAELLEMNRQEMEVSLEGEQDQDDPALRREISLLRSEQRNSEQLQRQYLFHIGRLHQETLRFDFDESEINGMATRLKDQAKTIDTLSKDLKAQHESAAKAQQKHVKWQAQLRDRLSALREDRRGEQQELAKMRGDVSEAWALARRQRDELAVEKNMRSKIENEILEMKPRVSRIGDYETRIKQLTDSQRLWDHDVRKRKEAEAWISEWQGRCHQLEGMLQSSTNELEDRAAAIYELERHLSAQPAPVHTAQAHPPEPKDLARYVDIANEAMQKVELLEREVARLRAQTEVGEVEEEKDPGTRAFLWG